MNVKTYMISNKILASGQARFFNRVVDYAAIIALFALMFLGIGILLELMDIDSTSYYLYLDDINKIEDYLLTSVVSVIYYFIFEKLNQRTFGKYLTKTVVVDIYGNPPTTNQIFQRSFARIIPFDALSFLGKDARGWHDTMSNTYVVYVDKLMEDKSNLLNIELIGIKDEDVV